MLAHEIGHVAQRHGVKKLERQLRTGSLVDILYHLLLGGEPDLLRHNALHLAGELWTRATRARTRRRRTGSRWST